MKLERLWLPLAALVLALTTVLLRFKTRYSGDSLFMERLATDLFKEGGRWVDWKFTAAPSFLPDMPLYFLAYFALPDAASRIFAVSAAQALLIAAAAVWFARQLSPQLSRRAMAVIVLAVALVTLAAARSGMWLYFYSTNNHLAALFGGLLAFVAALRYYERGSKRAAVALPVVLGLATVSTGLTTLSVTVPALLLLALTWTVQGRSPAAAAGRRRTGILFGLVVAGAVLAQLLAKVLIHHAPLEGKIHARPETAGRALVFFMQATASAFDPANPATLAVSVLLLAALLFLGWRLLRRFIPDNGGLRLTSGELRIDAAGALLACVVPVVLLGAILSGRFGDQYAHRYFVFPLALAALLSIVLLDRRGNARLWDVVLLCGSVAITAGAVATLRKAKPEENPNEIAACMTALVRQGEHLRAGISDFWLGPTVREHMVPKPPMINTLNDLSPNFWVSSIGPLLRPERYPQYRFDFVLMRAPVGDVGNSGYLPETIGKILPPPTRKHACPGTHVWVYDGPELDAAVRRSAADYLRAKDIRP